VAGNVNPRIKIRGLKTCGETAGGEPTSRLVG